MKNLNLDEVKLLPGIFNDAKMADISFIKKINPDRLLCGFRRSAGLDDMGLSPYGGWEDSRIGGHIMGHYLATLAQLVKSDADSEFSKKLDYLIEELRKCQLAMNNGFLFGAKLSFDEYPERQFDLEENKITMDNPDNEMLTWVPWYTLHKIFHGLLKVYNLCDNKDALKILKDLGDWVYKRVENWSDETVNLIRTKEYGGMSDCLYELYHITKQGKYKRAAAVFDDYPLMQKINSDNEDTLEGIHANTTIPKFLGAIEDHYEQAEMFWNRVVGRHVFVTGGTSDMEHFHKDYMLDSIRTQCNCEGCCAHNMLKLSHRLWEKNPAKGYADYSDRLLHNAILGAINKNDGTTAYFSPMATGYNKTFSNAEPDESLWWCCTGTGMENYTKLQEEIYFKNGEKLYVNQYIDSVARFDGMVIEQRNEFKTMLSERKMVSKFRYIKVEKKMTMVLRIPDWGVSVPVITSLGENIDYVEDNGYMYFEIKGTGEFTVEFEMAIRVDTLPDNSDVVCFTYGPFVLAAKLGMERLDEKANAGIDVYASAIKVVGQWGAAPEIEYGKTHTLILPTEELTISTGETKKDFLLNIEKHMEPVSGQPLHFVLTGTNAERIIGYPLEFVPYYEIINERYGIYWYLKEQFA